MGAIEKPSASVIVPACNEEAVIGRCLRALLADAEPGEFEVIVVCNGCDDATAEVARGFGEPVRVIETPVGSKPLALNLGDQAARAFPRIFVDADVEFSTTGLRAVRDLLAAGEAEAAAPQLRIDTSQASIGVRAYLAVWRRLPQIQAGLLGRGVYAVGEAGRARFASFPDIVADDFWIHELFPPERRAIAEAESTVRPPRTLRELLAQKTRVFAGVMELGRLGQARPRSRGRALLHAVRANPLISPAVPLYLAVNTLARRRGRRSQGGLAWRGSADFGR